MGTDPEHYIHPAHDMLIRCHPLGPPSSLCTKAVRSTLCPFLRSGLLPSPSPFIFLFLFFRNGKYRLRRFLHYQRIEFGLPFRYIQRVLIEIMYDASDTLMTRVISSKFWERCSVWYSTWLTSARLSQKKNKLFNKHMRGP